MKIFLCLIGFLYPLLLAAQEFVPIPADSSSKWIITRAEYVVWPCVNVYKSIYYINDTVISNGKVFYEIYESGRYHQDIADPPGPCDLTYYYDGVYRGAIRTEGRKTYQLVGNQELLLFDFTLDVGDTMNTYLPPGLIIESIDSVLVGNSYRKRFNLTGPYSYSTWLIEGVGHKKGLFEYMEAMLDFASYFHCYIENEEPIYGNLDCDLTAGIKGTYFVKTSSYPNPFSESTTLSYSLKQSETVQLSVFNQLGQLVYQYAEEQQQGSQQLQWDAQNQSEGLYYYQLKAGDNIATGKLVKVK